jgi:hypothetical protein
MNSYQRYKLNRKKIERIEVDINSFGECKNNKTVIIVPFRESDNKTKERTKQLFSFVEHYHNYIPNLEILIIEQSDDKKKFNRGALLNIGFDLAKESIGNIFIFHDVDLISPASISNVYCAYAEHPIHIANLWTEKYTFNDFLGGIISFNKKDFQKINGFPNDFWGWGGEDDAMYNRLVSSKIPVVKVKGDERIKGLEHTPQGESKETKNVSKTQGILSDLKNWRKNGLNNLNYNILSVEDFVYPNVQKVIVELRTYSSGN